jgi:hypothetical protein
MPQRCNGVADFPDLCINLLSAVLSAVLSAKAAVAKVEAALAEADAFLAILRGKSVV